MTFNLTRRVLIASQIVCAVGVLNFLIFVAIASYLGGDAVNGKVDDGRYYLYGVRSEAGHKTYTEVSEQVFEYSKWHVYSIFVTWPFVMLSAYAWSREGKGRTER